MNHALDKIGPLTDGRPQVTDVIALSKATMGNIHQNVGAALGSKLVFLVTTVLGITGLWPAILADSDAAVLVTAIAYSGSDGTYEHPNVDIRCGGFRREHAGVRARAIHPRRGSAARAGLPQRSEKPH